MNNVVGLTQIITLSRMDCGKCGGTYALNEIFRQKCEEDGKGWVCPYCKCEWGYFGDTEAARLRKQLAAEQRRVAFANDQAAMERKRRLSAEHRERAQKANVTKIKKRVQNGVCPCCNRTFLDLQRHMASKHADYVSQSN